MGFDFDWVPGLGFEGSVNVVIDLDNFLESGINFSYGSAVGDNWGFGFVVGYVQRELEGLTPLGVDVNGMNYGGTVINDEYGINGGSLTIMGVGIGASVSSQYSQTISIQDCIACFRQLF